MAIKFYDFVRVGNRSFWGSGRPRGPRRPLQKVGGEAPHLLEGSPGPPGPPRPQKWQISDPSKIENYLPKYSRVVGPDGPDRSPDPAREVKDIVPLVSLAV